ncbi:MAG: tetratricopeptide repeat protein [Planctomycetota bacterium]|nr:tetratricopeptide repeat protein [Planctomycetota bacterium]
MTQTDTNETDSTGKGKVFFDRADQVAETGNWDFAIELYIEGISREPDNIERGHKPLREVSLKRKAQGGKGPGIMEQLKRRPTKDPLVSLSNAEYLLAKEPGSVSYMIQLLRAVISLKLRDVVKWICDILLETQRQGKPRRSVLATVITAYHDIEEYTAALRACEMAHQLAPNDQKITEALKELSAKYTIQQGRYGEDGDFIKSVRDMDKQKDLISEDSLVKQQSYLEKQIDNARKEYLESPTVPGKVNALVDALLKFEDESYENEAIDVLAKAHTDTKAYQFKMRIGDIRIRQMTRKYRKLVAAGDKSAAADHTKRQLKFELGEYVERAANYPTDLALKFELGRRQYAAGKYDDAIASLQQAQRDPHRHLHALNLLGQCFAQKGLLREAADTYERALETEMTEARIKEIRYNYGGVLEQMDQLEKAQEQYSQVTQIDYNYKDARDRLENIRKRIG